MPASACLSVCTRERLLQLLLAGGALQQPPDGHNHMLKGWPLAWVLPPALLQDNTGVMRVAND